MNVERACAILHIDVELLDMDPEMVGRQYRKMSIKYHPDMTIHASQGETFKDPYTIYDWYMLCDKARYVALSRGTKLENIQID